MQQVTLPRTDLRVSNLCFGTADMGAGIDEAVSFQLLDQFVEAGGNFLDTALIYADWTPVGKGSSERLLGRWLRECKSEVVIATKGAHPELSSMGIGRMTPHEVGADLELSLQNLGIETIDLYYLHRDSPVIPVEEIVGFLEECVQQGKIRYYAFSNWKLPRAKAAAEAAQKMGARGFVANQPLWSLAQPDLTGGDQTLAPMDAEFIHWHQQNNFPAIPYSSQANGLFNKIAEGRELSPSLSSTYDSELVRPINRGRFGRLEDLATETGLSVTQIVLGYLLSQPFPVVPIVGCKNTAQLADSLSAAEVKLTTEQMKTLDGTTGS